jgi:DNA-binding transcriptional ArsR family regulator
VSKPAISRHLKVLEDAGVVVRAVRGRSHVLSLNVAALDETIDWLQQQKAVWERMFDAVDAQLRATGHPAAPPDRSTATDRAAATRSSWEPK